MTMFESITIYLTIKVNSKCHDKNNYYICIIMKDMLNRIRNYRKITKSLPFFVFTTSMLAILVLQHFKDLSKITLRREKK